MSSPFEFPGRRFRSRPLAAPTIAIAVYSVVVVVMLAVRPRPEGGLAWLPAALLTAAALVAGGLTLVAARRMRQPDRTSWMYIGAGVALWGLGQLARSFSELGSEGRVGSPSIADAGLLGMLVLVSAGLLTLRTRPRTRMPVKARLDAFLVMASSTTVAWWAVLGPIYASHQGALLDGAVRLAHPAGGLVLAFAVIVGIAHGWAPRRDPALRLLVAGVGCFLVADFASAFLLLHGFDAGGGPLEAGRPLGFLLIAHGALSRSRATASGMTAPEEHDRRDEEPSLLRMSAPYLIVLATAGFLFSSRFSERSGEQNVFVGLALTTVIAVVARQFVTLRENEQLNRDLHDFSQGLERKVAERTARLTALHALSSRLSAASSAEEIAELPVEAARLAASALDIEYASVLAVHNEGGTLRLVANSNGGVESLTPGPALPGLPVARALESMRAVVIEDGGAELERAPEERYGAGAVSGITVVIPQQERPYGVLNAYSRRSRGFAQDDVDFVQSVANALGQTMQRVRALDQLRREHDRVEHLLASISSVLVGVGADGDVQLWNRAARNTLQVEPAEVLGRPFRGVPLGWRWADVEQGVADCLRSREPVRIEDVRYVRGDGSEVYLNLAVNPVTDDRGDVTGYLLVGVDVTERRALEEQLTQTQRLEAIGQLAAGIAHEINTPTQYVGDNARFLADAFKDLASLLDEYHGLLEAAADGEPVAELAVQVRAAEERLDVDFLTAEIPRALEQSLEGVERVAEIVRAMREFSHPGSLDKSPIDLNRAIESTLTVARNEWKYVAEVETDFDGSLPPVPCLPGEFNQAVLNIVINAAHAIAEVVGNDGARKGTIHVSTRHLGEWAEVRIADTGGGIPEAIRARVFDPFYTTKQVGKGTGQGLAIARSVIVDKHEGTLAFESTTGEGTTFIIRLPIQAAAAQAA